VYFLGGKGGRCVRLTTLPPSCTVVMKSENHNFLEYSGPLQACTGTALVCYLLRLIWRMDFHIECYCAFGTTLCINCNIVKSKSPLSGNPPPKLRDFNSLPWKHVVKVILEQNYFFLFSKSVFPQIVCFFQFLLSLIRFLDVSAYRTLWLSGYETFSLVHQ